MKLSAALSLTFTFLHRYHVGESMLPSLRHYLRYIDIEKDFDAKGFTVKVILSPFVIPT